MSQVTEAQIKSKIANIQYWVIPGTTTTICNITLQNGFSVRGESACVDPNLFNMKMGEQYAYEKAFNEIWPLEGYLLKEQLYQESLKGAENGS